MIADERRLQQCGVEHSLYDDGKGTRMISMDDQTDTDHQQTDEEILTYQVSDDALEALAGTKTTAINVWSCREGPGGNCH